MNITTAQYNKLINSALRVLKRKELAEEAVQTAICRAIERGNNIQNWYAYLRTATFHSSIEIIRKDEGKFNYIGDLNEHIF